MSDITCVYIVTYYVKCAHARVDINHSAVCIDSKIREKTPVKEVCQSTEVGNPWITIIYNNPPQPEDEEPQPYLCICGDDMEPITIYAVENTYCGERKCQLDERFMRTPKEKLDAKFYFQLRIRSQELEKYEVHRLHEVLKQKERDFNKAMYKRALITHKNTEHFQVLDMRKYPKNPEKVLPNFLVPVTPPDDNCPICFYPLENTKNGEAVELPCKHTYHRNCIIESLIRKKECVMCHKSYEIFLFNGFEKTVYHTSIVKVDDRYGHEWLQPFIIQVAGYIPKGALDNIEERSHIKFLPKKLLEDKWGDYNGDSVEEEEAKFKREQAARIAKWKGNFSYHMDILDTVLEGEEAAENALREGLRDPRSADDSVATLDRLANNLEAGRKNRRDLEPEKGYNIIGGIDNNLHPEVLSSLGYQLIIDDKTDPETAEWFRYWVERGQRTPDRLAQAEERVSQLLYEAYDRLQDLISRSRSSLG